MPLRQRVIAVLDAIPAGLHADPVPAPRGGSRDLEKFRHRESTPALRAAGVGHRRVYDMRHGFATWAIEDGRLTLIVIALMMGTSVRELKSTYWRWLDRTDEQVRTFLDDYDAAPAR